MRAALLGTAVVVVGCSFVPDAATTGDGGKLDSTSPAIDSPPRIDAPRVIDAQPIDAAIDAPPIPAGWFDQRWLRRQEIELDNAGITSELDRFPVLVELTPANFEYGAVSPRGDDLRFVSTDPSNTLYDYDIDTFTPGGTSVIWVLVPKILAAPSAHTTFWLYSDNGSASAAGSSQKVWSDYVSVQHLNDGTDATTKGHDSAPAAANGLAPATVAGLIGSAAQFNGSNEALQLAKPMDFNLPSMTVGIWIKTPTFTQSFQCIVCKGDNAWRLQRQGPDHVFDFGTSDSGPNDIDGTTTVDDNAWHYIVGVFDASGGRHKFAYTDGKLEGSNSPGQINSNNTAVEIGNNSEQANRYYGGIADEFRITPILRNPVWIKTEYTMISGAGSAGSIVTVHGAQAI